MDYKEALFWITAIRMNYICDPHECHQDAYDPSDDVCHSCESKHDALAIAEECIKKVMREVDE